MLLAKIVITIAAGYVMVVALIAIAQTSVIFPVSMADAQAPVLPPDANRLTVTTSGGERLVGTHFKPKGGGQADRLMVLGFGGNGTNADGLALYLRGLFPDAHVVTFNYRGYAPSTGQPSAAALLEDSIVIHDFARQSIKPRRIVVIGMSIGSGFAAYLAKHRTLSGLILITPFDSLAAVARERYFWAPVSLLLRHRVPTIDFVRGRPTPTVVIASARDGIIPARRTEALKPAIKNLILDRIIAGVGHNGFYNHPDFVAAMAEALARFKMAK
jgi:pimeloyl-ACP methyl ester carboxylesterase